MKKTGLLYALILLSMNAFAELTYQVSFPKASGHYLTISIEGDVEPGMHTFQMPVWTPGSYKVREFSQNVDVFFARLNGKEQYVQRSDKNTWSIHTEEKGRLKVTYEVYAFELGVRTSYVDLEKAFIHGVSAFMFWKGRETERIKLTIHRLKEWKNDFAALPKNDQGDYLVENYDLLADSPIAAGNLDSTTYESGGCPHTVVMIGKGNYDLNKISTDFKAISDVEVKMFGGVHPSERYVHFIQNVDKGGGGLEHLNSQTSQVNRWVYSDEKAYVSFLGLIAHEYFHLWNVKRIRPIELGPFDYNTENYTDLLWVAEGITSYYDDLMLFRAGYHDVETYLKVVSIAINRLENSAGKNVMPLHMASRLAWVKAYLSNENTKNVTVSYYNKGMLVAWLLDLRILELTKGKKRLDDVMRALYKDYQKTGSGFTVEEFEKTCSEVANYNLDGFFDEYVRSIHSPPL